jgi:NADP-dependent 3-hydroxy acid dehydrogenase YdfG
MAEFTGLQAQEMIQPEDCAEVVRMCLRLSPSAQIREVVIQRAGAVGGVG